jgi:hydroxymethylglutaryl-CoA reductase
MDKSSKISGFYKLTPQDRVLFVKDLIGLTDEETRTLFTGGLQIDNANRMIENVVGLMPVPIGIAVNFLINGKDYIIPMATEEPSVVAAASNAAKMARVTGGFQTTSTEAVMKGQIQVVDVPDPHGSRITILKSKREILERANACDPVLTSIGGGAKDVEVRILDTSSGPMVIVELLVDCKDVMGANAVNTMAEVCGPFIEKLTGGRVCLRIISNLADHRLARARVLVSKNVVGGDEVVDDIVRAYVFATADQYRCATHNKGIMNGVTAVVLASGNDTRAIEAGAHSFASRTGVYQPLTTWEKNRDGDLVGTIELPVAVGIIGGLISSHPVAKVNLKIMRVQSAREFGEILAAVGLAQNLAALRALATEGIQRGHMALHARNIAVQAGATGDLIDRVAAQIVIEKSIRVDRAKDILEQLNKKSV